MDKLTDIKILKKYIFKKKINIFAPNLKYLRENLENIPPSDLNILVNFNIDDLRLIGKLLNKDFILFHSTVSIEDNFLPESLCINEKFFKDLNETRCKHLISLGAKFYGKEYHLKKYLNTYKNISLIPLNEIYKFESTLKFLPNSLVMTLLQVMKYKPEKINLFGFDLHVVPSNISNKSHYNHIKDSKFLSSIFITSDEHNYHKTFKLLKQFYKENKIEVDKNLKEIFEFSYKKNLIDFRLEKKDDLLKLLEKLKKVKLKKDLVKYNLIISKDIINNKQTLNVLNNLNTFNKLDKFINIKYDQNINYFNINLNFNLIDKVKIFYNGMKNVITPNIPNRNILMNIFEKLEHWDTLFKYKIKIKERLIIFKINFDINVYSKCLLLRVFQSNEKYIDIPLLKGSNTNEYLLENNCGEIKFEIINATLSKKAFWKIKSFKVQYVVC